MTPRAGSVRRNLPTWRSSCFCTGLCPAPRRTPPRRTDARRSDHGEYVKPTAAQLHEFSLIASFDGLSKQLAGDDHPLDLVGAFEYLRQLGVAHHAFDRI